MIVVETSAAIAMLFLEATAGALLARLQQDDERCMSVANYVEAGTVLAGRRTFERIEAIRILDGWLEEADIVLRPIDEQQSRLALEARIRFGRGMGSGGVLNFGDCFAYALARQLDAPLLFVGNDFSTTDVRQA